MAEFCTVVCVSVGSIMIALIGLQLLEWVADKYMDLRNKMIQIKYGEQRIDKIAQNWPEIERILEDLSDAE